MIYSLTGKVTRVDENLIEVNVNGVGYEVCASIDSIMELASKDQAKVYTYMHVREDAVSLFGFASLEEKRMFMNLISISGIGPKMAIQILSGMSARMLASAVVNKNVGMLTKIKGLGKKTAERIVLELKEKVEENIKVQNTTDGFEEIVVVEQGLTSDMIDAIAVLVELGIKKEEATKLVKTKAANTDKTEDIIKKCL